MNLLYQLSFPMRFSRDDDVLFEHDPSIAIVLFFCLIIQMYFGISTLISEYKFRYSHCDIYTVHQHKCPMVPLKMRRTHFYVKQRQHLEQTTSNIDKGLFNHQPLNQGMRKVMNC